ncbi:hypothetical protein DLAC_03731 [Tieghemostelium lacteum]|uniref:tRNA (guanine(46)-N(7))-methyltransferase n=1 Tax=Tieghemostelium lacteum TaxID=361077 RepID=A0A152A0N2_TIELA|nr:hypothetical protein DLAC_03731 [Tieghemostelium lacteum]|eukprot:KYQ99785.1 hypothetical protein DLAC_03731 [Tieghemostelium lacteum]
MSDLKRKFDSLGGVGLSRGISTLPQVKKLVIKNIPNSLNKNEVIESLKKIVQNPAITITLPAVMPKDIPEDTKIAYLSIPLAQYYIIKGQIDGKKIKDNKLNVADFELPKVVAPTPTPTPSPTTTKPTETIKVNKPTPSTQQHAIKEPKQEDQEKQVKKIKLDPKVENKNETTEASTTENTVVQEKKKKKKKEKKPKEPIVDNNNNNNNSKDSVDKDENEMNVDEKIENGNEEKVIEGTEKSEKKERQQLTVRNNRAVVTKITQQLVELSESKDFVSLNRSYNYLKKVGAKPDHITYGVMLNACVRCQEYKKAREVFQDALNSTFANEVVYTTFVKALCEIDMIEARDLISQMKQTSFGPNIRTYNSLLRGCVRSGDLEIADKLFREDLLPEDSKVKFDASTIEYIIKIYAQHLKITEIWELLGLVYESTEDLSPLCFSRLSLASVIKGDIKSSIKALEIVDDILSKAPKSMDSSHKNKGKLSEKNKTSSALFDRINRQEINEECQRVRDYLQQLQQSKVKSQNLSMEQSNRVYFSTKTFKFLKDDHPCQSGNKNFFTQLFNMYSQSPSAIASTNETSGEPTVQSLALQSKPLKKKKFIKMEICSGHGHWIIERAAQDMDTDWISVEIRYDRVFQIWSKMIMEQIDNLYILGGEAHTSVKDIVPSDTLDEVYINYPNPPVWSGSERLINEKFLIEINRILKTQGTLTIVTDNKQYSDQIIETITKSKKLQKIYKAAKGGSYLQNLSEDYGYSYFNKLWNNGQRTKRYCICISKL